MQLKIQYEHKIILVKKIVFILVKNNLITMSILKMIMTASVNNLKLKRMDIYYG
jgi:hypothetical protein